MKAFLMGILIIGGLTPFLLQAQGGWNIGYLECRSIEEKHIGESFKADFLPPCRERGKANKSYRFALSRADQVTLNLDSSPTRFVECRKIHDDWGFYQEQYLESVSANADNLQVRIQGMTLKEIKRNAFHFEAVVEYIRPGSRDRKTEVVRTATIPIEIKKRKLQGLMYQK